MSNAASLSRLSLNQYTTRRWSVAQAIDGCARAGIPAIGLWRDLVAQTSLENSAKLARDAGVQVSSLCRGGMFPAATAEERRRHIEDNRRAIDEAAALNTNVLVLVCGGIPERDIVGARQMVADGIAEIIPYAAERGIRLGIEPLHPMFAADRSVITTLAEANELVEWLQSPQVGIIIDVYHVWWDPAVEKEIKRAHGHILGFHVNDWLVPPPDVLLGRGMMGDGVIELRRLRTAVETAGYDDFIEVEIFNQHIWDMPGDAVLELIKQRYLEYV
ncbi:MAG: sugar phosphate isomerase/epimerase [Chloroflexi bacterium]|nr:sugar phosphate isomerase/epimerase [Chloroflexota bacterium]